MTEEQPRKKRDFLTPLLVTVSLHMMAFTLFVNHRLFSMVEPAAPGIYVLSVAIVGDDPEDEVQEEDAGAAPGEDSERLAPPTRLSEILDEARLPEIRPVVKAARPATEPSESDRAVDPRSLADRLAATIKNSGGEVGEPGELAGGGSHGLRGRGKHGIGLKRHGGSGRTEDAMELGLKWLASVQDADGRWDSDRYMQHYLFNPGFQERAAEGIGYARNDVGVTSLCLLAFTGAGNSHLEQGRYRGNVARAMEFLRGQQRKEDGGFGLLGSGMPTMYGHSLATLALLDLYLLSGDRQLRKPCKAALEYLLRMQRKGGGWDYRQLHAKSSPGKHSNRNDLSITGWAVLALVSAREAGFGVPCENLSRLVGYLKKSTTPTGEALYADKGTRAGAKGKAMQAVSNLCRRLLGEDGSSYIQQAQLKALAKHPPNWGGAGQVEGATMYEWYYGSLAMLLGRSSSGGADRWRNWNVSLKRTLLDNQCKKGARRGSFDPVGFWAENGGGRLYSTALCVLNLQIYYRYEPTYVREAAAKLSEYWD